jgi:hypothetical protein
MPKSGNASDVVFGALLGGAAAGVDGAASSVGAVNTTACAAASCGADVGVAGSDCEAVAAATARVPGCCADMVVVRASGAVAEGNAWLDVASAVAAASPFSPLGAAAGGSLTAAFGAVARALLLFRAFPSAPTATLAAGADAADGGVTAIAAVVTAAATAEAGAAGVLASPVLLAATLVPA